MTTSCPICRAVIAWRGPHVQRGGELWFVEAYRCGAVHRWGSGAAVLEPCPEVVAAQPDAPIVTRIPGPISDLWVVDYPNVVGLAFPTREKAMAAGWAALRAKP